MMKIALLGDSMVDTLFFTGEFLELKNVFACCKPSVSAELMNYGVETTDVELGLYRLTHDYEYKEKNRFLPSLVSRDPDVVVVESFAYNHWSRTDEDLERFILIHERIIKSLKDKTRAKLFFLSPIAPNREVFTKGILALGWSEARRVREYEMTRLYLERFVRYATSRDIPLIDCYHASLDGGDGNPRYISNVDFLHNSAAGRALNAKLIWQKLETVVLE